MTLTDTDKTRVIESHGMLQDLTAVVQQIRERQEAIEAKIDAQTQKRETIIAAVKRGISQILSQL